MTDLPSHLSQLPLWVDGANRLLLPFLLMIGVLAVLAVWRFSPRPTNSAPLGIRPVHCSILAVVALTLFLLMAEQVISHGALVAQTDAVQSTINQIAGGHLAHRFFARLTTLGNASVQIVLAGLLVIWLLLRREWLLAVLCAFAPACAGIGLRWIKLLAERVRPEMGQLHAQGYSFPSGHAMGSLLVFGLLAYVVLRCLHWVGLRRTIAVAALVLAPLIGFSRLVLQVHFPSDVLGGWLLALAWLSACVALAEMRKTLPR